MTLQRTIRAAQTLFYQGEATTKVYRVGDGLVRAYIINDNGEESTIAFFGPGDIFPITSAFDVSSATLFYYETVVASTLQIYSHAEFQAWLGENINHEVSRFATRYVGALLHVSALTQPTARMKLAHTLRYLAIRFGEKTPIGNRIKVVIKLTQHDIAKLCNLSRETVSIELGNLKQHEIVIVKEKYYYVHLVKLNTFINEDSPETIRLN